MYLYTKGELLSRARRAASKPALACLALSPLPPIHRSLQRLEDAPSTLLAALDRTETGRLERGKQRTPDLLARRRDETALRDLAVEVKQRSEGDGLQTGERA